ncbi:hypothetical protein P4V41_07490 [Fictibacillus nanhaiensis]|uniref:hypothetical protein n=1 Tax=Fictibacillus nanhaiensis TaxID=742169 RepID=UPI002E1A1396|nr:hypothetical protein [Fictibacillus nanhaiensis]
MKLEEIMIEHIEEINKDIRKNLGNSHRVELLKAKSTALLALAINEKSESNEEVY